MDTRFVGIKQFRQNMAKIASTAEKSKQRLIVMRKNKPIFELRPLKDEESLIESFHQDIGKARDDVRKGRVYSQDRVMKKLGL